MRQTVFAIATKDLREYLSSRTLMASVVALPLLLSLTVPFVVTLLLRNVPTAISPQITQFLPPALRQALTTMGPKQALYWYMFSVVALPMFLLLPITSVVVLASDSFAGEKERRTLETLVAEPVSPTELFLGKTLAPALVALVATWVSATIYWGLVELESSSVGVSLAPDAVWVVAMVATAPAATFANVALVAWISSFAKGFKEAQQLSGILIIPVAATTIVSATGTLVPTVTLNLSVAAIYFVLFLAMCLLWPRIVEPSSLAG